MLDKLRAALSSDNRQRLARKLLEEMDREGEPRLSPRRLRVEWAGSKDRARYSRFAERRTRELLAEREEMAPRRAEYEAARQRFIAEAHPALAKLAPPSLFPGQRDCGRDEETRRLARELLVQFPETRRRINQLDKDRPLVRVIGSIATRGNRWGSQLAIWSGTDELSLRTCLSASDDELEWIANALAQVDGGTAPNRPPYLLFLNRLFDELGAERIESMKKGGLEQEIRSRWPTDFGPPSNNLITPMATMLRSLEAKRGGAKRQQRSLQ